ncbi:MAG: hypothetical protein ACLTDM_11240 [Clostridium butyricum]
MDKSKWEVAPFLTLLNYIFNILIVYFLIKGELQICLMAALFSLVVNHEIRIKLLAFSLYELQKNFITVIRSFISTEDE